METINDSTIQEPKNELEDDADTVQLDVQNFVGLIEFDEQETLDIKLQLSHLNKKLS